MIRKMNKKGLEFKSAMFAIVAVGLVIGAVTVSIDEWDQAYTSNLPNDLSEFDKSTTIAGNATGYEEGITPQSSGTAEFTESRTFTGVFGILTTIFDPLGLISDKGGLLDVAGERFKIPTYIIFSISTFMVLAIVFALVAIIFRSPRRSV